MYPVTEMARARAFYEQTLGLPPSKAGATSPWVEFDLPGGGCLAITNVSESRPSANAGGMIALEVEDLDALVAGLKAKGVEIAGEGIEGPGCHMADGPGPGRQCDHPAQAEARRRMIRQPQARALLGVTGGADRHPRRRAGLRARAAVGRAGGGTAPQTMPPPRPRCRRTNQVAAAPPRPAIRTTRSPAGSPAAGRRRRPTARPTRVTITIRAAATARPAREGLWRIENGQLVVTVTHEAVGDPMAHEYIGLPNPETTRSRITRESQDRMVQVVRRPPGPHDALPAGPSQLRDMSRLAEAMAALEALGEAKVRDGMARYGIVTAERVLGVSMANIQKVAKQLGQRPRARGGALDTRVYEARLLVAYVADPAALTPAQMDAWTRDMDNWATPDTLAFKLFDQSPHAFAMVDRWADDPGEWVKRMAFAFLASLALHDKKRIDEPFLERLPLIEAAATDERNFIKKGVSWALRAIGGKKSPALRAAARAMADRLATSTDKTAKWIGRDAQKAFAKADG